MNKSVNLDFENWKYIPSKLASKDVDVITYLGKHSPAWIP